MSDPRPQQAPELGGVDDPAELVRIVTMLSRLNQEIAEVDLDPPTVDRLVDLHRRAVDALDDLLPEELVAELHRFSPPPREGERSGGDIRMAHLQLIGWLEGLVQGIQASAASIRLRDRLREVEPGPNPPTSPAAGTYL